MLQLSTPTSTLPLLLLSRYTRYYLLMSHMRAATPHAGNGNATLPLASSFDRVLASDLAPLSVAAAATCVQLLRAS